MKNIAILIYDYSLLGGVQRVTYNLTEQMKRNGLPIECLISLHNTVQVNYNYSVPVEVSHHDRVDEFWLRGVVDKYTIRNVIVQVEDLKVLYPIMAQLCSLGCCVFPVLHSSPYNWFRKYYDIDQYLSSPRFLLQNIKMRFYWRPLHYKLFRDVLDKYGMICVSNQARIELCEILSIPYDTDKVKYIYNPIFDGCLDVNVSNSKKNTIVYAGRLSIEKRPMVMLKLWKEIMPAFPEWTFYILGDGPERKRMENYIIKNDLKRVVLTGVVSNVFDYYGESKIAILLSKYEGLPTSILEAGLYENALLVSDSDGGAKDIVVNGLNGFIVDANNFSDILCKIRKMMDDDGALALKFGNANAKLLRKFSNASIIDAWKKVLD